MAETLNTIKNRASARAYKSEKVSDEIIEQIAEAGTHAPTGMNKQSPIILVIDDPEVRNELSRINAEVMHADTDPFYGAPNLIVVLADKTVPTYLYDGSLVMANMMTAAADLGVSTCWIHRAKEEFESDFGKELLAKAGIEGEYEGIANLILGYPEGETPAPKEHKDNYIYHI